jgi:cell division septation protein DedD
MSSREKKGGGDFVLESRHLVGLFMLLVVIFGVVFTLGYLMGRSQYDSRLRAAIGKPPEADPPSVMSAPKPVVKTDSPPNDDVAPSRKDADWDFYHSADPIPTDDHLQPAKKIVPAAQTPAPKPVPASRMIAASKGSSSPGASPAANGAIMLQVAAVQHEGDAMALAEALQQKKFPAFVAMPGADKFYRVQVGPYANAQAATNARHELEAKGFKSIVKR